MYILCVCIYYVEYSFLIIFIWTWNNNIITTYATKIICWRRVVRRIFLFLSLFVLISVGSIIFCMTTFITFYCSETHQTTVFKLNVDSRSAIVLWIVNVLNTWNIDILTNIIVWVGWYGNLCININIWYFYRFRYPIWRYVSIIDSYGYSICINIHTICVWCDRYIVLPICINTLQK